MTKKTALHNTLKITLRPEDNERLANLYGQYNENLKQIEKYLGVTINNRGHSFHIVGEQLAQRKTENILQQMYNATVSGKPLTLAEVHLYIRDIEASDTNNPEQAENNQESNKKLTIKTPKLNIIPRGKNQNAYVKNILQNDITFSVGPAGTGKTYLAVACAVDALLQENVERIVLVRPVVEAGEHLGFLPGDIAQKIDPYLRPLYDALYDMLGAKQVEKFIAEHIIEIAPLAFMRGRTLNSSFIILDESQNSTTEQMQMFLTRIGFGSKAIITGDITQIDLPKGKQSGLIHVLKILQNVEGISFNFFVARDVVRHPLVQRIIQAYAKHHEENKVPTSN